MKNREYLVENDIDFKFTQNPEDFVVDELPLGEFKGRGGFLILHIKKTEYTTWDMVAAFAGFLNIPATKIGYAGLKDKHATTTQYISIDAKHEQKLKKFKNKDIEILETFKHDKPIKMGDLKGNRFKIKLREITNIEAGQIEKIARKTSKNGLPNYFGFQRFGRDGDSLKQAKEIASGDLHIEDSKVHNFLVSIYQSDLFNKWLRDRVLLSREENDGKFKILDGDLFVSKNVPTGLLCGRGVKRASGNAGVLEQKYDDQFFQEKGYRREALVFPNILECNYIKKQTLMEIVFELPKGAYATVFLESIAGRNYTYKDVKAK